MKPSKTMANFVFRDVWALIAYYCRAAAPGHHGLAHGHGAVRLPAITLRGVPVRRADQHVGGHVLGVDMGAVVLVPGGHRPPQRHRLHGLAGAAGAAGAGDREPGGAAAPGCTRLHRCTLLTARHGMTLRINHNRTVAKRALQRKPKRK